MFNQLDLYANTIIKMKPSQIFARVKKKLGLKSTIGMKVKEEYLSILLFQTPAELDFDNAFIGRFNADEFLNGKVTLLNECEEFVWDGKWEVTNRSPLWNFNLHYFEYLMAYVNAYKKTQNKEYIEAIKTSINCWIKNNPKSKSGVGWSSYTISLRVVYWFSCLKELKSEFDDDFIERVTVSLYEQYKYLGEHLEIDIQANHLLENLKAIVLCAIAFDDKLILERALRELKNQCKEQILADGMHFELSPMYHKIVLEALIRIAVALRGIGKKDLEIENYIQSMIDVAYSFEQGTDRIPLFNDGGSNVAKSLRALLDAVKNHFEITPTFKAKLTYSGYFIYKWNDWKMIVDAGKPGPDYNPGHAHCDAMSYELYYKGTPIIVNCGTYAYQCKERSFFRSTAAHNTVMLDGDEQSQCWSVFRLGKRSNTRVINEDDSGITMEMIDQNNNKSLRKIMIEEDRIYVEDISENHYIDSYLHILKNSCITINQIICEAKEYQQHLYAPEYGLCQKVDVIVIKGMSKVAYSIDLSVCCD